MVTAPSLRVVFFGTPEFAVPTLEALVGSHHTVVSVVTQPDRPRGRGQKPSPSPVKATAESHHIPVLQPDRLKEEAFLEQMRSARPDLGVVAAYGKILPEALLQVPRLGLINVHASLLPRWRGASPIHRAVMAGDAETGISIMRVVKALDAGAVFDVVRRPIGAAETSEEVEEDLARLGATLLVAVADRMARGEATETPQDESLVTYAPRLAKEEGLVDWQRDALSLHNQVRGLHPWPHAFTSVGGARVILLRSRSTNEEATAAPGTITGVVGDALRVVAGDGGCLDLLRLQAEGRKPVTGREFAAGMRITAGMRFGA